MKFRHLVLLCSLILLLQVSYILLNTFKRNTHEAYITITPDINSKVSPLTGRTLASNRNQPMQVTYSPNSTQEFLSGISNADLIFEYLNKDGKLSYNAIFYDNPPYRTKPITTITNISMKNLPNFSFSSSINKLYSDKKKANYIFVTLSYNVFSNFIYEDNHYIHYRDSITDIDYANQQPVSISNIIVQYVKNTKGIENISAKSRGKGMLFCGGKVVEIEWSNDGNSPLKLVDENENPITLVEGNTWWLIVNDKCPVAFN